MYGSYTYSVNSLDKFIIIYTRIGCVYLQQFNYTTKSNRRYFDNNNNTIY